MRVAVVGHVEWVQFACVERLPERGEILHAGAYFEAAAGGGAVAAAQLARLAGGATLFTALADDELGERAAAELARHGVEVHAALRRQRAQRRAFTHLDGGGERTITVLGERLGPVGDDALPWELLDGVDGVYFTAGDGAALRQARRARVVVATPRAHQAIGEVGVEAGSAVGAGAAPLDALVLSGGDADERRWAVGVTPQPPLTVFTEGARGGHFASAAGRTTTYEAAHPPGPPVDSYGCGDAFAAGLTFGLASGLEDAAAIALATRCGAVCLTGRGPYGRMLSAAELGA
ncbi:MAG: PfkB family carbohydrate kinase [Solirubrobacteraceae bacterium]|nr:MAG: ribokinase [Solirubrobacterales bacterium]